MGLVKFCYIWLPWNGVQPLESWRTYVVVCQAIILHSLVKQAYNYTIIYQHFQLRLFVNNIYLGAIFLLYTCNTNSVKRSCTLTNSTWLPDTCTRIDSLSDRSVNCFHGRMFSAYCRENGIVFHKYESLF